jgi:hypothetical protein
MASDLTVDPSTDFNANGGAVSPIMGCGLSLAPASARTIIVVAIAIVVTMANTNETAAPVPAPGRCDLFIRASSASAGG